MDRLRGRNVGLIIALLGILSGIGIPLALMLKANRAEPPKEPLPVRLDDAGPYVILATQRAAKDYASAIEQAKTLHPKAERIDFDPADLAAIEKTLREKQPRFALVFIEPDELDVNFGWRWLAMTSRLDDDSFVDVRTGFITGATPADTEAFVARIAGAVGGKLKAPGAFVDNGGPPEQGNQQYFNVFPKSDWAPILAKRFTPRSIFHGKNGFTDDRLESMDGCGLVHFGGHGHPDRIDDGLTARQIPKLKLSPCVVFNGACYTGVTQRWFDTMTGVVAEKNVAADDCFCLKLLKNETLAYLAALHPDHGIPVYQEMELVAYRGGPLGDAIKFTFDGVVLGNGGRLPEFEQLKDGAAPPKWGPKEFMLHGTAARVLFGDPALVLCDAFTEPSFKVELKEESGGLRVTATLTNPELKSTFTNTYTQDLSPQAPFNDRALISFDLPQGWTKVQAVESIYACANPKSGDQPRGMTLQHKLVGFAVEVDRGIHRLHVQIDVPTTGFMQSPLRTAGAEVSFLAKR